MTILTTEKTFQHPVKVPLTEKEIIAYTDEFTALDNKSSELLLKHESEKSAYKSQSKNIAKEQSRLLHLLKTKEEFKQVECYNDFNWFDGIVEIRRTDTNEAVTTRKITTEEYQQNLPLENKISEE